ncbi:MAG: tRNA pseudouridine(38-40) synthase TruA, partial [Desulfomonilaceae bacterium]
DLDRLKEASLLIVGTHDFATFGTPTSGSPSTVREIFEAQWQESPQNATLAFSIRGSGFLRYMVRSLVGTLIQVGSGKVSVQDFRGIIDSCDRSRSGPTAPPHGLSLISVQYGH